MIIVDEQFPLGTIVITPGIQALEIPENDLQAILLRHADMDWGDICDEDKQSNDRCVLDRHDDMLLSSYLVDGLHKMNIVVLIITDAGWLHGHNITTILLPKEY